MTLTPPLTVNPAAGKGSVNDIVILLAQLEPIWKGLATDRKMRFQYAGAIYQAMSRGGRREPILAGDMDWRGFSKGSWL